MSKKLMLAGASVAALALVAIAALVLFRTGGGVSSDLRYLPNNTALIGSFQMSEILKSQAYKDLVAAAGKGDPTKEVEQQFGVPANDITRMTVGAAEKSKDAAIVVTTSKAVTGSELAGKLKRKMYKIGIKGDLTEEEQSRKFKEVKVGSFTMHEEEEEMRGRPGGPPPSAFCVVDKNTVVYSKADTLKGILERNKNVELSAEMRAALDQANQSRPIFVAINVKGMLAGAGKKGLPLDELGPAGAQAEKVDAMSIDAALASDAQLSVVALCKDNATADEIRKAVEGGLVLAKNLLPNMPKELTQAIDSVKVAASGNKVTGTGSLKPASLIPAMEFMGQPAKTEFKIEGKAIDFAGDPPPPLPKPKK